jgi:hypothetical protein
MRTPKKNRRSRGVALLGRRVASGPGGGLRAVFQQFDFNLLSIF